MASMLKRKRSDSELSFSSSTTLSSPSRLATRMDFSAAAAGDAETYASAMFRGFRAPSHLNSRTMKRTRNGRPSDAVVYERTLGLLYAAQGHAHHEPVPPEEHTGHCGGEDGRDEETPLPRSAPQDTEACAPHNQPSLYSFWNVSRSAVHKPQPLAVPDPTNIARQNDSEHCLMDAT